jgi:hypothetical protein
MPSTAASAVEPLSTRAVPQGYPTGSVPGRVGVSIPPPATSLCPRDRRPSRALDDQNEPAGRIGVSSLTFADYNGLAYCVVIASVRRAGPDIVVTVRAVDIGNRSFDMDDPNVGIGISLRYGTAATSALRTFQDEALRGILRPGATMIGSYAFSAPSDEPQVRVTVWAGLSVERFVVVGAIA